MITPEKLIWYRQKLDSVSLFLCSEQPKSKEAQDAWVTVLFVMSDLLCEAEGMMSHTSVSDVHRETAWLIEKAQHARPGPPVYWGWEDGEPRWTAEHQYAKRFDTKDAAEREADGCGLEDWIVAEHSWEPRPIPSTHTTD